MVELSRTTKSSAKYEINGEEYTKLQGGVPPEIKAMGLGTIELGDVEYDPIFAGQFDDQFGVTWTPTKVNQILGAFASTERLELGKKEVNKRISSINSESKVIAEELTNITKDLIVMRSLEDEAKEIASELSSLEGVVAGVEDQLKGITKVTTLMANLEPYADIQTLDALEMDTRPLHTLVKEGRALNILLETRGRLTLVTKALDWEQGSTVGASKLVQEIEAIDQLIDVSTSLRSFPEIPEAPEVSRLLELEKIIETIDKVCTLRNRFKEKSDRYEDLVAQLKALQIEQEGLHDQLKESEMTVCPSCGHKWSE